RQVVQADDAEVLGDPQAALAGRLVDAERLLVVAREDRGRRLGQAEQLAAADEAALVLEVAVPDQRGIEAQAGPLQGRPVTVDPGPAAQVVTGPGDGADPAVAQAEQVLGGGQARGPVGR